MHPHLNYLIAQQHAHELTAAADRQRTAGGAERPQPLWLADGIRLLLRPARPDDRERQAKLFGRLSPESRRQRFFVAKQHLTEKELDYLSDLDHVRHAAYAAVDPRDDSIVGLSRYIRGDDRAAEAEIAIEVADAFHNQGIGTALSGRTLRRAREVGIRVLTASTLRDNVPALALLRRFGFRPRHMCGGEVDFELRLEPHNGGADVE
jgi:RimJ/RimL family protein N-acetyltransferase